MHVDDGFMYTVIWSGIGTHSLLVLSSSPCSVSTCVLLNVSYIISGKEKQATFTGREQRLGVWVLPHLVARLFDRGRPKAPLAADKTRDPRVAEANDLTGEAVEHDADAAENELLYPQAAGDRKAEAAARVLLRTLLGGIGDSGSGCDEGHDEDGAADGGVPGVTALDAEDRAAARANVRWNWVAYRSAFPHTPPHAAITAMFAQYALLVGRITRHLGGTASAPMTLTEGAAIGEDARVFITRYVTPILGPIHTTKIHKLLAHVLDAVRLHGTLRNGDTSANEGKHKDDKRHYARTNRGRDYTRQLVRHAQGARTVLRNNKVAAMAEEQEGNSGNDAEYDSGGEECNTAGVVCVGGPGGAVDGGGPSAPPAGATPSPKPAAMQVALMTVEELSQLPGMGALGDLLGLRASERVGSPAFLLIEAHLDGGGTLRQLLRASSICHGAPWHDHVMYSPFPEAAERRYGQVRLFVRGGDGRTFAVVARMRLVGASVCPLSARGCLQLRWEMDASGARDAADAVSRVVLELVPLGDIVRMVHIVPDVGDLFSRQGLGADPPSFGGSGPLVEDMLYLLNAFMPVRPE